MGEKPRLPGPVGTRRGPGPPQFGQKHRRGTSGDVSRVAPPHTRALVARNHTICAFCLLSAVHQLYSSVRQYNRILKAGPPKSAKSTKCTTVPKYFRGDPVGSGDRSHAFPGLLGGLSNLMYGIFEIPIFDGVPALQKSVFLQNPTSGSFPQGIYLKKVDRM